MNKKELMDEIINLKERKRVVDVMCGNAPQTNLNVFSKEEIHNIETGLCLGIDVDIEKDMLDAKIEVDEIMLKKMIH